MYREVRGRRVGFTLSVHLRQVGPPTGIETLEADTFRLECYQTPTGIKFLMLAEPRVSALDTVLKQIYSL